VTATEKEVEARFEDRRWVFPRGDCVLLPVANTTAELVARYIGLKLIDMLASQHGARPERVVIELDECNGQLAVWKYQSTPHAPS